MFPCKQILWTFYWNEFKFSVEILTTHFFSSFIGKRSNSPSKQVAKRSSGTVIFVFLPLEMLNMGKRSRKTKFLPEKDIVWEQQMFRKLFRCMIQVLTICQNYPVFSTCTCICLSLNSDSLPQHSRKWWPWLFHNFLLSKT